MGHSHTFLQSQRESNRKAPRPDVYVAARPQSDKEDRLSGLVAVTYKENFSLTTTAACYTSCGTQDVLATPKYGH